MAHQLRIGFIGLGYMGHGMARNIRLRGFPVTVQAHRRRDAVDDLVALGATEARSAAQVARLSDVVVLCVTGADQVDALVRGRNGLASGAAADLIIVDCTTSEPSTLLNLSKDYPAITFVDSPLGRSPKEAWEGKLSVMVGCDDQEAFERIRPVLSAFADAIQYVGQLGNGHRLKLVNNLVSLGYAALYSEAIVMARKAGLTIDAVDELLSSSRMHCAFYETFMGWARSGDANSHRFALGTALHTVSDIDGFEQSLGLNGVMASAMGKIYEAAVEDGLASSMLPELPRSVGMSNGVEITPANEEGEK
ncbi:MAG TPA: NAD(P)-dependent oxidoreductase [Gammaproteobacteria bacterium]|nr:NAD(P)-dependent oxidoreductase [Gammaproteobacteria bacterium]